MSSENVAKQYGDEYLQWKDWNVKAFSTLSKQQEADLSAQLRKAPVAFPPLSRVLEIGFGNGSFLAYGVKRHWEMHGTEVNPALLKAARDKGYHVHGEGLNVFPDSSFHLVVAFDVLEHIPQSQLLDFLQEVQRILRDGGVFVARFPNGDSPFSRFLQHGDPTHITAIGNQKARYFANRLGVQLLYLGGEAETLFVGWRCFLHRAFAVPIKALMTFFLNLIFSPRAPMAFCSINLLLIFRVTKHGD